MDYVRLGDLITAAPIVKCGDGTYPVLSMTMHDGIMLQSDRFKKSLASIDQSNYKVVSNGQLVIGFPIDEGVLYVQRVVDKGIMSPAYNVWDINTNLVLPEYLELALHSPFAMDYYKSKLRGTTARRRTLPTNELLALPVILPNLDVQKEVISTCNKAESLIALRKEQLAKLDQLVKSRFIELFGDTILNPFGWDKSMLGSVCDVRDGTHDSPQYYEIGYPLVTSKNVTGGKIDLTDCSLICKADFDKINERSKVDIGDIIMPMIGTVGKPVVVDIEPNFAIKNVALIKFKTDSKVLNIYIRALLQSDYFEDAVLSKVRGGTQKFISLGDIRKLEVLVPPMKIQKQFATFVEQTDKSKLAIQESLAELEALKKALMQKYFG